MAGRAHANHAIRTTLLVALIVLVPERALAGNDDEVFLGNQAALSGGAVTATVNEGSALIYEPSGLVEGRDDTVDVSVTALGLRVHHADDDERNTYQITTAQRGSAISASAGFGYRITDALRFGASLTFAYDNDDVTLQLGGSRVVTSGGEELTTDFITVQVLIGSSLRF